MRYAPCWKQIGISVERYFELLHFCRQYPEWKTDTQRKEKKIAMVDECAKAIGQGEWYSAMIEHICYKKPPNKIDVALRPNSARNDFYKMRRQFFELLNQKKE